MFDWFAISIILLLDLIATLIISLLAFDLGFYLKVLNVKKKNFKKFMLSKQKFGMPHPIVDLFFLIVVIIMSVFYIVAHFSLIGWNPIFIYLVLIPLSLVLGYLTNPDNLKSIESPEINILGFKIDVSPPGGIRGSILSFNKNDSLTLFYNFTKKLIKFVLTLFYILLFVAFLFVLITVIF